MRLGSPPTEVVGLGPGVQVCSKRRVCAGPARSPLWGPLVGRSTHALGAGAGGPIEYALAQGAGNPPLQQRSRCSGVWSALSGDCGRAGAAGDQAPKGRAAGAARRAVDRMSTREAPRPRRSARTPSPRSADHTPETPTTLPQSLDATPPPAHQYHTA